ncbi:hypothetical protein CEXT_183761 [Caerostris extrusa]|uniref:Uncharacterized protein n=1 Tax=Caerostris extrusa TaxID=172846 RepID=A0AAV4MFV8_CAEEX|nr:hypothetical protein CEXT_183761 [Caerostris extrusa]
MRLAYTSYQRFVLFHFCAFRWLRQAFMKLARITRTPKKKMLKHILAYNQNVDFKVLFSLFITHQSSPFTLSAWGFFYFTKGLVLSAIGSALTYSLLMIQIDTSVILRN